MICSRHISEFRDIHIGLWLNTDILIEYTVVINILVSPLQREIVDKLLLVTTNSKMITNSRHRSYAIKPYRAYADPQCTIKAFWCARIVIFVRRFWHLIRSVPIVRKGLEHLLCSSNDIKIVLNLLSCSFLNQSRILYRDILGFATDFLGVWCRGLSTCVLYVDRSIVNIV